MKYLIVFAYFIQLFQLNEALNGVAQLTYYHSYAPCCKGNPNYDPNAPTDECDYYSAW